MLKYALVTTACTAVIIYVALFFGAGGIAQIFNKKGAPEVQNIATLGIRLYFISVLFSGFNLLFSCYFAASNKGLYAQIVTLMRGIITIIPLAFIFANLWNMTGLWLATPAAELITLAVTLTIFFVNKKKNSVPTQAQLYIKE